MKPTIVGLMVLVTVLLFPLEVHALTIPNIRVTPTIKITETPTPTKTVIPTDEIILTPTLQPTIDLSPTVGITAINEGNQDNLTIWFLAATIGLLLIIVVAQAWPRKDDGNDQS